MSRAELSLSAPAPLRHDVAPGQLGRRWGLLLRGARAFAFGVLSIPLGVATLLVRDNTSRKRGRWLNGGLPHPSLG